MGRHQTWHPMVELRRDWKDTPRDELAAGVIFGGDAMQVGGASLLGREAGRYDPGAMLNRVFSAGGQQ